MNKIIVLFEIIKADGKKIYEFDSIDFNPDAKQCKQLSTELEKIRQDRLTISPSMINEVNIINFQFV